jgi:hypothetical protein
VNLHVLYLGKACSLGFNVIWDMANALGSLGQGNKKLTTLIHVPLIEPYELGPQLH